MVAVAGPEADAAVSPKQAPYLAYISPYLAYISPVSPLYFAYISTVSPLYLPYISWLAPRPSAPSRCPRCNPMSRLTMWWRFVACGVGGERG